MVKWCLLMLYKCQCQIIYCSAQRSIWPLFNTACFQTCCSGARLQTHILVRVTKQIEVLGFFCNTADLWNLCKIFYEVICVDVVFKTFLEEGETFLQLSKCHTSDLLISNTAKIIV